MEKNIAKILEDLYKVDINLKSHEDDLKKIIKELLESRPDTQFDEQFMLSLREEILAQASSLKSSQEVFKDTPDKKQPIHFFRFNKLTYALGGVAIIILITLPFINGGIVKKSSNQNKDFSLNIENKITKLDSNAFGSLSDVANQGSANLKAEEAVSSQAKGIGGGGGTLAIPRDDVVAGQEIGTANTSVSKMIAPEYVNYNYVYIGEQLPVLDSQVDVYRKLKQTQPSMDFSNAISNINPGFIDLDRFKNKKIMNLNITEDRKFGYAIDFNLREQNISIGINWEQWPRPDEDCRDQACYERHRLKISDVPADKEIIDIADNFLREYNISMNNYGEGKVLNQWRRSYDMNEDKERAWIPDTISVIYPLKINGDEIYNELGEKDGLTVHVNIRHKKAAGLYGMSVQNFESSSYIAETDNNRFIKYAENGGRWHTYMHPESTKTIDIKLDTPKLVLVKYWRYDNESRRGSELYVPSYIFPIINNSATNFWRENIVVPVIKEMLDERDNNFIEPILRPMPLIEPMKIMEEVEAIEIDE